MNVSIYLNAADGSFHAMGLYSKDKTIVLKDSLIKLNVSKGFKGSEIVVRLRNDNNIVNTKGELLVDCEFSSPSTAAQFVTGRISNGYIAWRVDEKNNLGRYLERVKTKGSKQSY